MEASEVFLLVTLIFTMLAESTVVSEFLKASACYGNTNNFLELSCKSGEVIAVKEVLYGAKLKSDNCPVPTVNNNHPSSCCHYKNTTDCAFTRPQGPGAQPDPYITLCDGKQNCTMRTTWQDTTGHCVDRFMSLTNFMELTYICVLTPNNVAASPSSTTSPSTSTTTSSSTSITTSTSSSTSTTSTTSRTSTQIQTEATKTTKPENRGTESDQNLSHSRSHTEAMITTPSRTTSTLRASLSPSSPSPSESSPSPSSSSSSSTGSSSSATGRHVEMDVSYTTTQRRPEDYTSSFAFTTGMMGGMTAAIVGLMLTIFGFLFYWGRRKRKLTTTKPNSTVWDFLLAHTVAARTFRRGYDNFSNNRDSVSSETDVTHGKQTWLPNIRVEPGMDTMSVTSDENCSIVNISTLDSGNATISSRHDRSEV